MDTETKLREELSAARNLIASLRLVLQSVPRIASEAFNYWDADEDHKVGKILRALSGGLPGYRSDIDQIVQAGKEECGITWVS